MRFAIEAVNRHRPGPFVIVGRPHSGTRAVASALMRAGVFFGSDVVPKFLDSEIWYCRFVLPLLADPRMPELLSDHTDPKREALIENYLSDTLEHFFRGHDTADSRPWGWKLSETLFLMRELHERFPRARFVHVVRDGRDVVLSDDGYFQLTKRPRRRRTPSRLAKTLRIYLTNPHRRFARRHDRRRFFEYVTFGRSGVQSWRGIDLSDERAVSANRYLLQMQSWVHCVGTARRLSKVLGPAYMELRYEDFCREPERQAEAMFRFLDIDPPSSVIDRVSAEVSTARIGKWRRVRFEDPGEAADFDAAITHGSELLRVLGYEPATTTAAW